MGDCWPTCTVPLTLTPTHRAEWSLVTAYSTAGVSSKVILQCWMLVLVAAGLMVLGWLVERTKTDTYQALVKCVLGRRAEVFCEVVASAVIGC